MSDEVLSVVSRLATTVDVLRGELASGFAEVHAAVAQLHEEAMQEGDARDQAWLARLGQELARLSAELRHEIATQLECERVAWQRLLQRRLPQRAQKTQRDEGQ